MQEDIFEKLQTWGQKHLVDHYNSIKDPQLQQSFLLQLKGVDLKQTSQLFDDVYLRTKNQCEENKEVNFQLPGNMVNRKQIEAQQDEFDKIGMEAIAKGEIAVCIMSGGQGTRLGFDHPKGMFNIDLDSKCTLFQFFARRLLRLNQIAKQSFPDSKWKTSNMVKWYIMTSEMNHKEIQDFFIQHHYFGYDSAAMCFFPQGGIPALDYNGKIIIESQGNLCLAPGGNGAIYCEMKERGALEHMKKNGVKYTYIISVDNVLAKVADPTCAGYMIKNNLDIVSTYVKKAYPEQKVGLHVLVDGKVNIKEYSEFPVELTKVKDMNGDLKYCHGNRATTFMSTAFLEKITTSEEVIRKINRKYHLAEKKIKCYDCKTGESVKPVQNNGMKFQLFYFDVFEECDKFGLFQTIREEEFAPVKNAEGLDSPASARKLVRDLHRKWLERAGVIMQGQGYAEIDPRVSYNGEGLAEYVKNKYGEKVSLPAYIS